MKAKTLQNHSIFALTMGLALAFSAASLPMASAAPTGVSKKHKPKNKKIAHKKDATKHPALNFKMKDIDGKKQNLKQFYGNVVLMVNTASRCGFTPQYSGLEKLYQEHHKDGFVILGFPANNFGHQEPGSDEQIKAFCSQNYKVTFPLFSKVSVKGEDICDLYQYLTDKESGHKHSGDIRWNFTKILINRKGEIIGRFFSSITPEDNKLVSAIKKELAKKIPADSPLAKKKKSPKTHG